MYIGNTLASFSSSENVPWKIDLLIKKVSVCTQYPINCKIDMWNTIAFPPTGNLMIEY